MMSQRIIGRLVALALFFVLAAGWQWAVNAKILPAFILPGPFNVIRQVYFDFTSVAVWSDIVFTMTEIIGGFLAALVCGVTLGAAIALIPILDEILSPYVIALQTIPKIAIAPLLIIWFGFGVESKIVIVALVDLFPILVNSVTGFRSVDPRQLLLMNALDSSGWKIFWKIRMPNALPYLLAGIQIAMVFSIIGAIVGEFLGSTRGLGSQVVVRQSSMDVVGVFSLLVILTVIGVALNSLTKAISKRVAFWNEQQVTGF